MSRVKTFPRRSFVKQGLALGAALPFATSTLASGLPDFASSPAPMNILILGGTSFLGPHQVAYALGRGHKIATFTRGRSLPTVHQSLFKQVNSLIGDRENDLKALESGQWDLVIDNSGRKVEWTQKTAEMLKDRAKLYLYTSSTGVYYPYLGDNIKEDTKLLRKEPDNPAEEEKLEYWYGVMKANSELAALNAFGKKRTIIVRPTYMMGPADKTDRFIHWPLRLARGGDIMVPGRSDDPVQYIDVRDVAEWMIRLAEEKVTGTFNAVGPRSPQTMSGFIAEASKTFDVKSNFIVVDDYEFLNKHKVPYLVPWIPSEGKNYGSSRVNNTKGIANGLTFRPLQQSIRDTYEWWVSDALTDERRAKFEQDPKAVINREAEILEAWNNR